MALITEEDLINRVKRKTIEGYVYETSINKASILLNEYKTFFKNPLSPKVMIFSCLIVPLMQDMLQV